MTVFQIAGIDPGLRTTGYAIVNYEPKEHAIWVSNGGIVRTPDDKKGLVALMWMIEQMQAVSRKDCFKGVKNVVVEFPAAFYNPQFSASNLTPVAAVSGACMTLFNDPTGKKVLPAYPSEWNGGKKKDQIAALVHELVGIPDEWGFESKPTRSADFEHVIDAVGMAYWMAERTFFPPEGGEKPIWDSKRARAKEVATTLPSTNSSGFWKDLSKKKSGKLTS